MTLTEEEIATIFTTDSVVMTTSSVLPGTTSISTNSHTSASTTTSSSITPITSPSTSVLAPVTSPVATVTSPGLSAVRISIDEPALAPEGAARDVPQLEGDTAESDFKARTSKIAEKFSKQVFSRSFNPLLHRLFLDHDIIFYFKTRLKNFKKNLS